MDWGAKTIQVYDEKAAEFAKKFVGIGSRVEDIERGLELAGVKMGARVVEIGCGDGRDAVEIVKRVRWYEGVDPSKSFLEIARAKVPRTSFVLEDALGYQYPANLDVVFAFASLLHINRNDFVKVGKKVRVALKKSGIFYINLKEKETYKEELQQDEFGERMFYYYNLDEVKRLTAGLFESVFEKQYQIGNTNWFSIALKKL